MKRCIKGGFLVLGGVVGVVGMIIAAMQNPSVEWVTPPGRMIISILENGLLIPTVLFLVLRVNPKFCVNSIWGANRAKFIQGGSRFPAAAFSTT